MTLFTKAIGVIILYLLWQLLHRIYSVYFGPMSKYPGPFLRAFTILPAAWSLGRGDDAVDHTEMHQKYGPVVRVGPNSLSFAGSAQIWKDIYGQRKDAPMLHKDPAFYVPPINGVDSLITVADDADHKFQRRVMASGFSEKALREQEPLLVSWASKLRDKLAERDGEVDIMRMFNFTTFDIMADLTFGESLGMLENGAYSPWVAKIFASMAVITVIRSINILGPIPRLMVRGMLSLVPGIKKQEMDHWNYTQARVDKRLNSTPHHPDLWSHILDANKGESGGLSLANHHSNGGLFMIAGTETSSTALAGATYYLLTNRACLERLTDEIRTHFHSMDDISFEALARLPYLNAVLQEVLRVYPPVPSLLPRTTPAGGMAIAGEWIPGGVTVGVHPLATARMEENFTKPYEFHPERWLHDPDFATDKLDSLEPFSVGPRNCLGKNFAWHEMRLLLATVLLHFDLQLSVNSKDWTTNQAVYTLWEKRPLLCTLTPAKGR